ncbi:AtpZ/AtpI family protein [Plantactinospora sp. KLBMP9567]|uniref:AtpZ/AtpI family protein n=1 Tax=Plantactinospora sp. KLBMP9567 TaxID=3085900 RepID=UPI002981B6E0|nr:AtpZ/AtpI family protein [Plantactinospora sp. KLBMP9567]MDW5323398.1 AtpZ/AtpI family protein [Plantactinospora sp. KLBMP9567]
MTGDQTPQPPGGSGTPEAGEGWTALAYLIGGLAVWGCIGWLVDQWLETGGLATGIGFLLGGAGGVYLVIRRLGTPS